MGTAYGWLIYIYTAGVLSIFSIMTILLQSLAMQTFGVKVAAKGSRLFEFQGFH